MHSTSAAKLVLVLVSAEAFNAFRTAVMEETDIAALMPRRQGENGKVPTSAKRRRSMALEPLLKRRFVHTVRFG
jgi:hypothetical protein